MNTSLLKMRKLIATFTIGTLLASFMVVPAAFAAGTPDWATAGADAYLNAETRDSGYVMSNKCEVATMIVRALELPIGESEREAGAQFQDLQGGMAWCQEAAGAVAVNGIALGQTPGSVFGTTGDVSRAVVATMLVRAFSLDTAYTPAALSDERQAEFAGMEWAQEAMALGVAAGIIQGNDKGELMPQSGGSKWAVATMLHRAANLSADDTTTDDVVTDDAQPEVAPTGGAMTVSLSSDSADSATVPSGTSGLAVATFTFAAGSDAVLLSSLSLDRGGFSDDDTLDKVTLIDSDGVRVSKSRSFTSEDDRATLNLLDGGVTIPANSAVDLTAVVSLGASPANEEFNLSLTSADLVGSNASSVSGSFPVTSHTMKVSSVSANMLTVLKGTAPANPDLGDNDVIVNRFQLKADDSSVVGSTSTADVYFHGMTFKNTGTIDADEINNFSLLIEDEVVATVASIVNDFIVFNLAEPMLLEDQKTYDADVTADIIGGPAKTLILTVDSNLDIRAKDAVYGYGTGVLTTDFTANLRTVTVQAGELTITAIDAPNTDITDDRTDVVLGTVRVTTVTGQQLELQKLSFDFTNTLAAVLNTVFENIEVYLPSTGAVYSLTDLGAATTGTSEDSDLGILLPDTGSLDIQLRADIKDGANMAATNVEIKVSDIGNATKSTSGLHIIELEEDTVLSDITPNSLSFAALEGKSPDLTAASLVLSNASYVHGSEGVVMQKSKLSATAASDIYVDSLTYDVSAVADNVGRATQTLTVTAVNDDSAASKIAVGTDECAIAQAAADATKAASALRVSGIINDCAKFSTTYVAAAETFTVSYLGDVVAENITFDANGDSLAITVTDTDNVKIDNTRVSQARLYVDSVDEANLIDTLSAARFSGDGVMSMDSFETSSAHVDAGGNVLIPADGDRTFYLVFDLVSDDNQSNDTIITKLDAVSAQDSDNDDASKAALASVSTRTLTIRGSGSLTATIDNTDPLTDRNKYILGGSSEIVASVEMTALNEDLTIEDFEVVFGQVGGEQAEAHYSYVELLDENMDQIAIEDVTKETVTFTAVNYSMLQGTRNIYIRVHASEMGKDKAGAQNTNVLQTLTLQAKKVRGQKLLSTIAATGASNQFGAIPVHIANLAFLSSTDGVTIESKLTSGSNNISIFSVEAAPHTTTETTDGSVSDTKVNGVYFDLDKLSGTNDTYITSATIERIGRNDAPLTMYNYPKDKGTLTLTIGDLDAVKASVVINGVLSESIAEAADGDGNNEAAALAAAITNADNGATAAANAAEVTITSGANAGVLITDIANATTALPTLTIGDLAADVKASVIINGVQFESIVGTGDGNGDLEAQDLLAKINAATATTGVSAAGGAAILTLTSTSTSGQRAVLDSITNITAANNDFLGTDKLYAPIGDFSAEAELIGPGDTANYLIKADITADGTNDNDDYIEIDLDSLGGRVQYVNTDTVSNKTTIRDPRLSRSFVDGVKISE